MNIIKTAAQALSGKEETVEIEVVKDGWTSPSIGNTYIGQKATVLKSVAEPWVKSGKVKLINKKQDKKQQKENEEQAEEEQAENTKKSKNGK